MKKINVVNLVMAALLCAIGIVIPMFSPVKIVIPPASFTLGSHVAIMIAMFISPAVAVAVSLGTTLGFFLGGFPIIIVLRALTHVVFALLFAIVLKKMPAILKSPVQSTIYSLVIGLIHAVCEVVIVTVFYMGDNVSEAYYESGYFTAVILLVGVGTVVHSMVDFGISLAVWKPLKLSRVVKSATA